MIICAIDPGLNGAVAILNDEGHLEAFDMPTMGEGKQRVVNGPALARRLLEVHVERAVIELAQPMPKEGVSAVFRYGQSYGTCIGVIQGLFLPVSHVSASKWKQGAGLTRDKEFSRRRAIETFPNFDHFFQRKKDHNRAEAALLANWFMVSNLPLGGA